MEEEEAKPLNESSPSSCDVIIDANDAVGHTLSKAAMPNSSTASPRLFASKRTWTSATIFFSVVIIILCGVFISGFDVVMFTSTVSSFFSNVTPSTASPSTNRAFHQYPLNCSRSTNVTNPQKCPYYPTTLVVSGSEYTAACPDYFRWIHEDLRPWRESGITREAIESRKSLAHFRLVVYKGKAYLEQFHRAWQTRDIFTLWGILQLLRMYPGRVPDLEMMFCCEDLPAIPKRDNQVPNNQTAPPAMFHYCGHEEAFDIPFPDWSFWGWPEVNIRPWTSTLKAIKERAAKKTWRKRDPHAFWKGNPGVSPKRGDLMNCNPNKDMDWNARLEVVDWGHETSNGFKESRLEDQCRHRYKIYVEGRAWSVSEKYILACDAATLLIKPEYYDFFVRGMIPMEHYWPIRPDNKCRDIKFAVDWGNKHPSKAEKIGAEGSRFAEESLSIKRVYEYMLHLLTEYAKLHKFEVTVPPAAVELCSETMACPEPEEGIVKEYMMETLVKFPSTELPCSMPPPYEPGELEMLMQRKENMSRKIETWEAEYWDKLTTKQH